jgi:hypothetical protein
MQARDYPGTLAVFAEYRRCNTDRSCAYSAYIKYNNTFYAMFSPAKVRGGLRDSWPCGMHYGGGRNAGAPTWFAIIRGNIWPLRCKESRLKTNKT